MNVAAASWSICGVVIDLMMQRSSTTRDVCGSNSHTGMPGTDDGIGSMVPRISTGA